MSMFLAWGASVYRPTRDIDFLGFATNELDAMARIIRDICIQEVEPDGLAFDRHTVENERIKEDADYEGVRVNLVGYLGKAKIPLQIDIGFTRAAKLGFRLEPAVLEVSLGRPSKCSTVRCLRVLT